MFINEDKEEIKKKILSGYCFAKPNTKFAEVIDKLGIDVGIKLVDFFSEKVILVPSKKSLQRSALPKIIQNDLDGLKPKSEEFKFKVKSLASFYLLTKKAIIKMNDSGRYTR